MNENLKYFSKLAIAVLSSYAKIFTLTFITTIVTAITGYFLLKKNIPVNNESTEGFLSFIPTSYTISPVGTVLWVLAIVATPIIILIFSNNYVVNKTINKVIQDKSDSVIYPFLDNIISKLKDQQPDQVKEVADYSFDKIKIVQQIKEDASQNKWVKRILTYGIERTNIDPELFNIDHNNFYDIFKVKIIEKLDSLSDPTRTPILTVLGVQLLVILFIAITDY